MKPTTIGACIKYPLTVFKTTKQSNIFVRAFGVAKKCHFCRSMWFCTPLEKILRSPILVHADKFGNLSVNFYLCRQLRHGKTKHKKEGSTRLPKFPAVQMPTGDLASKPLNYGDVPLLRYCALLFRIFFFLCRLEGMAL